MNSCAVFTVGNSESDPSTLHYLYKEGKNVTASSEAKRERDQLLVYIGGFSILNELSGPSAHKHTIFTIDSKTIGVARRDQTYVVFIKDQRVPPDDMLAALDMVLFLIYAHLPDYRSPSLLNNLNDSITSALNAFLFRFLADSPFALVLLRDHHHIPLPKHILTPILASATLLSHMRTVLHSIGGALIRNGRTIVSDLGPFLTNFVLIKSTVTVFSDLPVGQAIPSKNYISLQNLFFDESLGNLSLIRDRIRKSTNSILQKDLGSTERLQSDGSNRPGSDEDLSLSVLSASSSNSSLNETVFSVQLLLVKCILHPSASNTQLDSHIILALLFSKQTQVSINHDFMGGLVHSLLLIYARLADCTSYTPVYPFATSAAVKISVERTIEAFDPLLPVPVKEAQISASKTKRSLSTYSMTDLSLTGLQQFSSQEVSMATGDSVPHSTVSIYGDRSGQSYVLMEKVNEDGVILKKKPLERTLSISDTLLTDI
ncbi:Hypothetical protein GLP15_989 [Giardia lamblia P15]|uniref:Uncharacterized protein n=1 Tax=Giardia intestinalis (strain P15) TaxID=658858 RepID=E1F343_GIAIA|nr:Hypothetical protein GLP15_989 [Giardia lamblia P15]